MVPITINPIPKFPITWTNKTKIKTLTILNFNKTKINTNEWIQWYQNQVQQTSIDKYCAVIKGIIDLIIWAINIEHESFFSWKIMFN